MLKRLIISQIIVWIFLYAFGAFISMEPSVFAWTAESRAALVVLSTFIGLSVFALWNIEERWNH